MPTPTVTVWRPPTDPTDPTDPTVTCHLDPNLWRCSTPAVVAAALVAEAEAEAAAAVVVVVVVVVVRAACRRSTSACESDAKGEATLT